MIAIVRISGEVEIPQKAGETLDRLRLRRKFSCVVLPERPEVMGMVEKVRNFVAYGKIDRDTFIALIKERGQKIGKAKIDAEKIVDEVLNAKTEIKLSDFGLKPFFRLHPARGGIKSKMHFPKGVLGNHKEKINELIKRML